MFLYNNGDQTPHQTFLTIVGDSNATINVTNPSTGWSTTATLTANQSVQISVPLSSSTSPQSNTTQTKSLGLHTTSTTSVSVSAMNHKLKCNDLALIYPSQALGTRYIMQDYMGALDRADLSGAEVGFVATLDNTTLTMVLPCNLLNNSARTSNTLTVNLMQGQSYQLIASAPGSFSGMEVTSNGKPFAAFQGNRVAYIPNGNSGGGDMVYEQAVPVDHWGTDYVVVPTYGRSGDQVRITSSEDNCQLYRNNTLVQTLQKGDTYEESLSSTTHYTSSKKICVGRYLRSSTAGGNPGDPASVMVPPADQGIQRIRFSPRNETEFSAHYINIVAPNSCVPGITLDGANISNQFTQYDNSYSFARIPATQGMHLLESPLGPIVADLYGLGDHAGYASTLGRSFCETQPEETDLCSGEGDDFWMMFLYNMNINSGQWSSERSLVVAGDQNSSIHVEGPNGLVQNFNLAAGTYNDAHTYGDNQLVVATPFDGGYHITSQNPIYAFSRNHVTNTQDIAALLPSSALGTRYITQGYPSTNYGDQLGFVATEDSTVLTMTVPCDVYNTTITAGTIISPTLMRGQAYLLQATGNGATFAGMEVTSNGKPFAMFQGGWNPAVPINGSGRDHCFEQALPVAQWGTEFVLTGATTQNRSNILVITAADSNCIVNVNGTAAVVLAARQTYQHTLMPTDIIHITTSSPVSVTLYLGSFQNNGIGDPSSVLIPPIERGIHKSHFFLPQCSDINQTNHYLVIACESSASPNLRLDGSPLPTANHTVTATGSYDLHRLRLNAGGHSLECSTGNFSAYAYGLGNWESYAFPLGFCLEDPPEPPEPTLTHDTILFFDTVCQGEEYRLPASFAVDGRTYTPPIEGLIYLSADSTAQPGALQRWSNWVVDDTVHHIGLTLIVLPSAHTTVNDIIIAGDTLLFADSLITLAGTYTFHYTAQNGCDSVLTLNVSYESVGLATSAEGLCPGEEVTLTATGTHTYLWSASPADSMLNALQGQNPINVRPEQTTTYSLLDAAGNVIASITVGVEPPPTLCIESNRSFIDFDHPVLMLHDCSTDRHHTTWQYSDGPTLSGERARRHFHHPLPDSVSVTMTSCNRYNCCADTTVVFVTKIRSVWFPNIFFPDQQSNNRFGCHTSFEVQDFELYIYNRQGLLVWHTDDISVSWDGTHDGTPVPQGAYVYRWYLTDIYGERRDGIGTVTLIR